MRYGFPVHPKNDRTRDPKSWARLAVWRAESGLRPGTELAPNYPAGMTRDCDRRHSETHRS